MTTHGLPTATQWEGMSLTTTLPAPMVLTDDGTRLEIDFLIQRNGKLLPIEVKAEGNVRAKYCPTRVIYLNLAYRN